MRKTALAPIVIFLLVTVFASSVPEPPFFPMSPDIMAEGGAMTATAHGYESFFTNPAGFSRSPGDFTLASATSWIYARPDHALNLLKGLSAVSAGPADILGFLSGEAMAGGIGMGAQMGIGWGANGLGLGAFLLLDSYAFGPSLMGINGDLTGTLAFVAGFSVPFQYGGFTFHFGGDVRPMIRIHALMSSQTLIDVFDRLAIRKDFVASLNSSDALHGVGLGIDLGSIVELGGFSLGISMRDFGGTIFGYTNSPFAKVIGSLSAGRNMPAGLPVENVTIPMDVSAGIAYHPDLGAWKNFIDPTIHVDIQDIVGAAFFEKPIWDYLHAGAVVKFLSVFTVRAGLDQGYITLGGGIRLFFLDVNFAFFTRELGEHVLDRPSSGVSLDAAIRF
jgi:hypothetical protein